jgi:acetyl esterase/lipase
MQRVDRFLDAALLTLATVGWLTPLPALAQSLLSASDVVALEAPPPEHRLAYGADPLQFGHLRLPTGPGPFPVVVLVHGGCWLSAYDIGHVGTLEQAWAEAGYAVWSLEYRRVGDDGGGWPGTYLDVAAGADHLRILARSFPLDLERVIASGHSAGASFALWLAARAGVPTGSELWRPDPLPVHGVLALAPAPDLEGLHASGVCGSVIDRLMGGGPEQVPERYAATSMMRLAPPGVPQIAVIGVLDAAWAPVGHRWIARVATASGDALEVREAPESGHFEMIVPGTSTWPLVMEALADLRARLEAGVR